MSRYLVIAFFAGSFASATLAIIWIVSAPQGEHAVVTAPPGLKRSQNAKNFLGGDPNRPVRGGQEMKPRW